MVSQSRPLLFDSFSTIIFLLFPFLRKKQEPWVNYSFSSLPLWLMFWFDLAMVDVLNDWEMVDGAMVGMVDGAMVGIVAGLTDW